MLRHHQEEGARFNCAQFHYREAARTGKTDVLDDKLKDAEFSHVLVVLRQDDGGEGYADLCRAHYDTLYSCASVPMLVLTFEDLERVPTYMGRVISSFCGFAWKGWPKSALATTS
jgi:hypothetical protein